MQVSEICTRQAVTCGRDAGIRELAQLMRDGHVGDVVVVDRRNGSVVPVGIVTDRDLVVRVLAKELDVAAVTAGDLMAQPLETVVDSESLNDAIWHMRSRGIRRLPVVDGRGSLLGIVSMDDIAAHLAADLADMVRIVPSQSEREKKAFAPSAA